MTVLFYFIFSLCLMKNVFFSFADDTIETASENQEDLLQSVLEEHSRLTDSDGTLAPKSKINTNFKFLQAEVQETFSAQELLDEIGPEIEFLVSDLSSLLFTENFIFRLGPIFIAENAKSQNMTIGEFEKFINSYSAAIGKIFEKYRDLDSPSDRVEKRLLTTLTMLEVVATSLPLLIEKKYLASMYNYIISTDSENRIGVHIHFSDYIEKGETFSPSDSATVTVKQSTRTKSGQLYGAVTVVLEEDLITNMLLNVRTPVTMRSSPVVSFLLSKSGRLSGRRIVLDSIETMVTFKLSARAINKKIDHKAICAKFIHANFEWNEISPPFGEIGESASCNFKQPSMFSVLMQRDYKSVRAAGTTKELPLYLIITFAVIKFVIT